MKKLMIAACAVAFAAAAQAAQFVWNITDADDGDLSAFAYNTVYIMDSPLASGLTLAALQESAYTLMGDTVSENGKSALLDDGRSVETGAITFLSGADEKFTKSFVAVIVNTAEDGYFTMEMNNLQGYSSTDNTEETRIDGNAVAAAWEANGSQYSSFGGGGDTPEPTSGLLLLIGVAGLALKRKRA